MKRYLVICLGLLPTLAWAAIPSPQMLWQEIQGLQKAHAVMPESTPHQIGSRSVDPFTTDLANAAAVQSIRQGGGIVRVERYTNGSLVVKENYNAQKKLVGVTAMLKAKGYDAADRNWVMAAYKPDGTLVSFGKVGSCIACHELVRHQDLVFAPPPAQLLSVTTWKAFFPKQEMNPAYVMLLRKYPQHIVQ
ncbi:cytochrome P460 family protein [Candidatus Igneacidithiobacillus taiwanensis]|uniref:cytochrome P460 family protein n=1 Tax=Candidatus Igneacidithiobacillus taiwanensis TaxID=1945924 RepID=UPI00289B39C7|nr:cytochrome P460 family protein [Candidatus Igneacidithiobacillus taiwanensis]MCE5360777.1 cytochrome P460 family protein [Acidithiobacillus sp.]